MKRARHERRRRVPLKNPASAGGGRVYIYGKHTLVEALTNTPQVVRKVFLSPEVKDAELRTLLAQHKITPHHLAPGRGKELVGDTAHQGVIATINPALLLTSLDEFLTSVDVTKNPAVAVLGEVQDPHNVGAIIRSAAAFGLSAVFVPEHNQAGITGAVVKVSSGMVFRIPLVSVGNTNHALRTLKEKGFWIYGLAQKGQKALGAEVFDTPSAFVIGNEGMGVREKTLATCDVTLSIPIHERTESLNAAVSAAVVFYEWSRKHPEALLRSEATGGQAL